MQTVFYLQKKEGEKYLSVNYEGIKTRGYGIEIECTGITRNQAAKAVAKVLESYAVNEGGPYDKYTIKVDHSQ